MKIKAITMGIVLAACVVLNSCVRDVLVENLYPDPTPDPGYTDDGQGNYTVTSAEGLKNIAKLVNEPSW